MAIEDTVLKAGIALVALTLLCPIAAAEPPVCRSELPTATKVFGGVIDVTTKKSWQPPGGQFTFVVESPVVIPDDAVIAVCFGWKYEGQWPNPKEFRDTPQPARIVKIESDKKTITIAATVPDLPPGPPRFSAELRGSHAGQYGAYRGFYTVPVADVRILRSA